VIASRMPSRGSSGGVYGASQEHIEGLWRRFQPFFETMSCRAAIMARAGSCGEQCLACGHLDMIDLNGDVRSARNRMPCTHHGLKTAQDAPGRTKALKSRPYTPDMVKAPPAARSAAYCAGCWWLPVAGCRFRGHGYSGLGGKFSNHPDSTMSCSSSSFVIDLLCSASWRDQFHTD